MPLTSLSLRGFRNLEPVSLQFSPQLNLIVGANAAGKTSLLESLYVLGRARSFRSKSLDRVIQSGSSGFQLVASVGTDGEREIPVGLLREDRKLIARINGHPVQRLSDLAALFPIQWLGGNLQRLIEEGPAHRRQYLDWGLFHVKPAYMGAWKRFQKIVRQRNAALRASASRKEIQAWDRELACVGEELDHFREAYLAALESEIQETVARLLPEAEPLEMRYRKGWAAELSYLAALEKGFNRDREQGYTRSGPHRADLLFLFQGRPANEQLSRGQQKLLVTALQVAQAKFLRGESEQGSLFLMDDLGAELDPENQRRVMQLLYSINAQVFVTAIQEPVYKDWRMNDIQRFHVKHGVVTKDGILP